MGVNRVILLGRVGADPEIQYFEGNSRARARFRFATTEHYRDKQGNRQEQTEWHTVVFWGSICRVIEQHVRKGQQLYIEGRIRYRQWVDEQQQKHYATEIAGDTFHFVGGSPRPGGVEGANPSAGVQGGMPEGSQGGMQLNEADGSYVLPNGEAFPF
ncbi:MAG: single-stranded DNA-binding protein [Bacteroidetes bacterium]|nr:MAG: single-stranded DNA-binding protein [Bacteroidota bacterium]